MAQGLERESKGQSRSKDTDEKISKFVRCGEGRVMGSRRIFPPQFKLQVLDSYRKDEDCKGNQRATARKYGIHRRQIQKWLQVEASLRTSVEVGSERRQASPTALNLTSAGDAARQRDDSGSGGGGGGGGGESLLVAAAEAEPTRWPRGGERRELCEEVRRLDGIEIDRRPDIPSSFLHILKDETEEEEDDDEEEEDDDEEDDEEEEGISEEDNMDSARGAYNNDEALDFSCAALGKRRSFSLQFKLEVLNAFHADGMCHGNQRATARKFGINRRQVQKWLGQEVELRGEAAFRGGLYRQRLGRWLEMEEGARKGAEDHLAAAAMSAAVMFDQYAASSEYCWDLSSKKRKLEEEAAVAAAVECKRARVVSPAAGAKGACPRDDDDAEEDSVKTTGAGEARDVSSTSGRDPREDAPAAFVRGRAPAPVAAPAPAPAPPPAAAPAVPAPAPAPLDEQETALCLVKVKGEAEVTSSIDAHPFLHDPFLARHPPFHIGPLALPAAAYDFYSFHCRHPCLQHLQTPKWFQSRAAAVPGFF